MLETTEMLSSRKILGINKRSYVWERDMWAMQHRQYWGLENIKSTINIQVDGWY